MSQQMKDVYRENRNKTIHEESEKGNEKKDKKKKKKKEDKSKGAQQTDAQPKVDEGHADNPEFSPNIRYLPLIPVGIRIIQYMLTAPAVNSFFLRY